MNGQSPAGWPAGKTLALMVNVMLEAWSDDSAPHNSSSTPPRPGFVDTRGQSWARFGPQSGAPRLQKMLTAHGVKATFFTNGLVAERYPDLVSSIAADGHSVQCHGYYQNEPPLYQEESRERESIARTREVMTKVLGHAPRGWLSPFVRPSVGTPANLIREGFSWHADACDSDLPYRQTVGSQSIVATPFDSDVNDLRIHLGLGNPPQAFTDTFERALKTWYGRHPEPACLNFTAHAHVFGRPYGAGEFETALEIALACPFVWIVTHDQLADTVA